MAVLSSDISYTLSGGVSNIDPNASLGGAPSSQVISGNGLFDDISEDEANVGLVDYRCIYIANNNLADSLTEVTLTLVDDVSSGSTVSFGVPTSTDIQRMTVTDTAEPTGGSFTISYEGNNVEVPFNADETVWATHLQNGLNALDLLSGVVVTVAVTTTDSWTITFTISFLGDDDSRNHDLLELVTNGLTGDNPVIAISKISEGSPVNAEAQEIPFDTTDPFGITFQTNPIEFAEFKPLDVIPVWIRRETPAGTEALANDGVTVRLIGKQG